MKQWKQSVLGCMTAGLLMMTSFPVFAADSSSDPSGKSQPVTEGSTFDDGTLTYTILKNMQVSVTGCITTATNISIMPKIDGYTVVPSVTKHLPAVLLCNLSPCRMVSLKSAMVHFNPAHRCKALRSQTALQKFQTGHF